MASSNPSRGSSVNRRLFGCPVVKKVALEKEVRTDGERGEIGKASQLAGCAFKARLCSHSCRTIINFYCFIEL